MLGRFINNFIDVIYPKTCRVCGNRLKTNSVDNLICLDCWSKIKKNAPPFCRRCGRNLKNNHFLKNICPQCQRTDFGFDRAFSPCVYEGVVKVLISQFKYRGNDYIGTSLSRLLIDFVEDYNLELKLFDLIAPVPLHPKKLREREFNQAQILSKCLAGKFGMELSTNNLIRVRDTSTQTDLADRERWHNVAGSFTVRDGSHLKRKNILLIDDVLTTGATCSEASRALKEAGAGVVFVLTLAN